MANNNKLFKDGNIYAVPANITVDDVAKNLKVYLMNEENMEVQILRTENNSCVVQARTPKALLKSIAGLDKIIAVKLTPVGDTNIVVEIGKGKWFDKGVAGSIGWFLCWPFAVTAAVGAYKQGTLPRKVLTNIESYLAA